MTTALSVIGNNFAAISPIGFDEKLAEFGHDLTAFCVDTLQVNVGKLCNQACKH